MNMNVVNNDGITNTRARGKIEKLVSTFIPPGIEPERGGHHGNRCACQATPRRWFTTLSGLQVVKFTLEIAANPGSHSVGISKCDKWALWT